MGVAACIVVFTLVKASLFAPIAVPQIDRVVKLGSLEQGDYAGGLAPIQVINLGKLPSVRQVGAATPAVSSVTVQNADRAIMVASWHVSKEFLDVLRMPMQIGRGFNENENKPNGPQAALISHGYWQQHFAGNSSALNKSLLVNGVSIPIVGVLPLEFPYKNADIIFPLTFDSSNTSWSGSFNVIARVDNNVSYEMISSALYSRLHSLDVEHKRESLGKYHHYIAQPLESVLRAETRTSTIMTIFAGCAAVLLLIVLINLSNLSLLRIVAHNHDSAVRRALGAPIFRLLLPTVAEQFLVAVFGCILGLSLAWVSLKLANNVLPSYWFISASSRPEISLLSVLFAFVLSLFVVAIALAFGWWRIRFTSMKDVLVSGGRTGNDRKSGKLGSLLVTIQAALATVLLLVAALSARTYWNSSQVDYGFDGEHSLAFHIKPDRGTYPDQEAVMIMADGMVTRLESVAGVMRVGYGTNIPASGTDHNDTAPFLMDNGSVLDSITAYLVSPGYFESLGMEIQQGREFDRGHSTNTDTIIITEELEKHIQTSMLGQKLTLPYNSVNSAWENLPLSIRGIAKGVRAYGPNRQKPPIVWIPFMANTEKLYNLWRDSDSLWFIVKVHGDPASFKDEVLDAANDIAPTLSVGRLEPISEYQALNLYTQRLNLVLILVFSGVALSLSSIGMYSVMAVSVAGRKHEFGVRAALGAKPSRLMIDVFKSGGISLGIGLIVGLIVAATVSKFIERFLYGVSAADPYSIVIIVAVLILSGLIACLAPAMRAARTRPMQSLRMD
ncbi:permease [Idiomarina xiamenensis 10-D-4]|uniref:Permease n=2 Tax=Idiomarina xiamenensis TaxID=1207041 RepID=K2KP25_9GAMM|nr:permease [Idiomarina xiamenensis 10-D-4]